MVKQSATADFIIIGAGIVGLCIARELKKRYPDAAIAVLEKENTVGEHASGRNSGVLHAGFYYSKDSLKAKFTRLGNQLWTNYCLEKNLPIQRCGKLVVARNSQELDGLDELFSRAQQHAIPVKLISAQEARELEPRVKTFEKALYSPTTASVFPQRILAQVLADARAEGIHVYLGEKYLAKKGNKLITSSLVIEGAYVVNAAGLYADQIAKDFGFSRDYTILPFKGLYLYATAPSEKLSTHVYPVPDLANPFLGVHFTLTADGKVKIGPTAIPAFWREHYQGLKDFKLTEMCAIVARELALFLHAGFDFRRLAIQELIKYNRRVLIKQAAALVNDVHPKAYTAWGRPGIRAQLLNTKTRQLEMDFILEGDDHSFHILNAVSPAFTCAFPFAHAVVDQIEVKLRG